MIKAIFTLSPEFIKRAITGTFLAIILAGSYIVASPPFVSGLLLVILAYILLYEWPQFKLPELSPLYPIAPFIMMIFLNSTAERILLPLLFITVSVYDVAAYAVGKTVGRNKLYPTISPGKTWEGVLGGYCVSLLSAAAYLWFIKKNIPLQLIVPVTLIVITATIGDLFESYLKRRVYLKDAGSSLPGHGGILDRFDGILGAILIVYPCKAWFIKLCGLA